jgi:hypothetical protein
MGRAGHHPYGSTMSIRTGGQMRDERWYERFAWVVFVGIGAVGLLAGVMVLIDPGSGIDVFDGFGHPAPVAVAHDAAAASYLEVVFAWTAGQTIGFDIFAIAVAVTAFRRGERWAWLISWFWPVLFLSHFFLYESGFRYAQLVWASLSVAALAATARNVWSSPRTSDHGQTPPVGVSA